VHENEEGEGGGGVAAPVQLEDELEVNVNREEIDAVIEDVLACAGLARLEVTKEKIEALFLSQRISAFSPETICAEVAGRSFFGFDRKIVERDEALLREKGSLGALVAFRIGERRTGSISTERIERYDLSAADPDRVARLKRHADTGCAMPSPRAFRAVATSIPKESGLVKSVSLPLLEKIQDKVLRGKAVVTRANMLSGKYASEGTHLSPMHVVPKPIEGGYTIRPVVNYVDHKGEGDEMKQKVSELYGEQKLTTVLDKIALVNTALTIAELTNRRVVLNHYDVKDAYDQMALIPEQAPEFSYCVRDPVLGLLVVTPISPQMGHPASGAAFGDASYAAVVAIRAATHGSALTTHYVDDVFQASFVGPAVEDKPFEQAAETTVDVLNGIFGEGAVAAAKTVVGATDLVDCGYRFSVGTKGEESVEFSLRGLLKAAAVLCSMGEDGSNGVTLERRLQAQSYGSRLATIYPEVKPLLATLYSMTKGIKPTATNRGARLVLDEPARACIKILKAFLIMLVLDNGSLACRPRRLSSFLPRPLKHQLEYDASLTGGGIIISQADGEGGWIREAVTAFRFPFELVHKESSADEAIVSAASRRKRRKRGNAAMQNSAEFITGLIGLVLLVARGVRDINVKLKGDSKTAIAWARKCSFRSSLVTNAAAIWVRTAAAANVGTEEEEHVSALKNEECDWLSREGVDNPLARFPQLELWPVNGLVAELLALCDPTRVAVGSTAEVFADWMRYEALVAAIVKK